MNTAEEGRYLIMLAGFHDFMLPSFVPFEAYPVEVLKDRGTYALQ